MPSASTSRPISPTVAMLSSFRLRRRPASVLLAISSFGAKAAADKSNLTHGLLYFLRPFSHLKSSGASDRHGPGGPHERQKDNRSGRSGLRSGPGRDGHG